MEDYQVTRSEMEEVLNNIKDKHPQKTMIEMLLKHFELYENITCYTYKNFAILFIRQVEDINKSYDVFQAIALNNEIDAEDLEKFVNTKSSNYKLIKNIHSSFSDDSGNI